MAHKQENIKRISDSRVQKVWEVMHDRKLNLTKLAALSSISYAHLNKVMNGVKVLNLDVLEQIAKGLKLPLEYFLESNIENDRLPKPRKKYQLMSEILSGIKEVLLEAEKQNVDGIKKFFSDEPTRPLIATGHGGKYSQAVYAALLYGTYQSLGRAITCYSCNSLSDATIQNSKMLLVSKGMSNIDIQYIAKRCIDLNPDYTCAVRFKGEKEDDALIRKLEEKCRYSFQYDLEIADGFISIRSIFMLMALFYKAFTGDDDFVSKLQLNLNPEANYTYSSADNIASVPSLDKISHFTVLYGSYGEPVAYNIESNLVEAGIASCMVSDYKNYTHGRFMLEGNYIKSKYHPSTDAALICLVTPRETNIYEKLLEQLPSHLPVITIRTDFLTPLASLDLLYKANVFASHLGEYYHKTNPNDPTLFSSIDKRVPKNHVHFETDFKIWGALDAESENKLLAKTKKDLKANIDSLDDLFRLRDEILENETWRTGKARINWQRSKPLTLDDFSFRQIHKYDTQEVECWSFNSKTDVRDGVSLQLGNMANGYGVEILGIQFPNSEVPYQLAIFNENAVKVQEEIIDPSKEWLTNGLKMKRKFIYSQEHWMHRRDKEFEIGNGLWCFEWMKWIIWEKVKQNKEFADILLSIPRNAVIIEQAQNKPKTKPSMWGAWNDELLKEREIIKRTSQIEKGLGKTSRTLKDEIYKVNNTGVWVGENAMGQILTMAKLCLNEHIQMPIDILLLNDARINWFGRVLHFTESSDGTVTVKAISPRTRKVNSTTDNMK